MKQLVKKMFASAPPSTGELLASLPAQFRSALLSMYAGDPQTGDDGEKHAIDSFTRISPEQGMWIYQLIRELRPQATLEIGLGYGFSTLYFLAGILANGAGRHTAVDPAEREYWSGIALEKIQELNLEAWFRFIEERSAAALADLTRKGERFDMIFIDGNHRFDDVLVDFTLAAEVCVEGGHIIVDDTWLPSIRKVVSFIENNRADFVRTPSRIENAALFKRIAQDSRDWRHFTDFS